MDQPRLSPSTGSQPSTINSQPATNMGELVFNPNLPAEHSPISSAELRTQLQALQLEIDGRVTNEQLNDVTTNLQAELGQKASTAELTDGLNNLTAQTPSNVDGVDALAL